MMVSNLCFLQQESQQLTLEDKELSGVKFDHDKIRLDLLPTELMEDVGEVLTFGAQKYGDRNWEKGMNWSRPYAALLRHMYAWWRGEDKDPETGFSHLAHAACNIAFLLTFKKREKGLDDRPKINET